MPCTFSWFTFSRIRRRRHVVTCLRQLGLTFRETWSGLLGGGGCASGREQVSPQVSRQQLGRFHGPLNKSRAGLGADYWTKESPFCAWWLVSSATACSHSIAIFFFWGGGGSWDLDTPTFLAHDVRFLKLGPKLDTPPPTLQKSCIRPCYDHWG